MRPLLVAPLSRLAPVFTGVRSCRDPSLEGHHGAAAHVTGALRGAKGEGGSGGATGVGVAGGVGAYPSPGGAGPACAGGGRGR